MMIKHILLITFMIAMFSFAVYGENQAMQLTISQMKNSTWTDQDISYSIYVATVINTGTSMVYDATIIPESNFNIQRRSDLWKLDFVEAIPKDLQHAKLHFPQYISQIGLAFNTTFTFGYITKGSEPAIFSITDLVYTK
ncbi:cellulose-binding domain-containing protein [Dictyostelium discoideum AX4]|uniref:Cellulose-binding domain-containing protein n=1 Tax=Dictyostelium discoideum TaxID=44689 RepID=Q55BZ8_DICDI|nr:cellulose-binding domain-containing protein [Dictyostelium discoideum AX4]EAL72495.1 cellulose-binding domain-containing protein [Dictyostelium discoideum AX4]|eukprot:XP_646683.1 cellulose-binding domain-containing protein [Dictyostelium discoideum AX4]